MTRLVLLILLLLLPVPAWSDIECTTSTPDAESSVTNQTTSFTPGAGDNRVVIVGVHFRDTDADNTTVTSLTSNAGGTFTPYGSVIRQGGGGADWGAYLFYSTDFADGAQTLTTTYSTAVLQGGTAAYTCTGVDTTNPFRNTAATATGTSTAAATVDVTGTEIGGLVIEASTAGTLTATPTIGANQTQTYQLGFGSGNIDIQGSKEDSNGGTVTMSWTTLTGGDAWAIVAAELVPAPAASTSKQGPIWFQ